MCKILDDVILLKYAQVAARKLNISIPKSGEILKQMNVVTPMPILLDNGEFQLWIDKYYIAFSKLDEEEVRYVYLAETHILEEYIAFENERKRKKIKVSVPQIIRKSFNRAINSMRRTGLQYYLDKRFFEIG